MLRKDTEDGISTHFYYTQYPSINARAYVFIYLSLSTYLSIHSSIHLFIDHTALLTSMSLDDLRGAMCRSLPKIKKERFCRLLLPAF